MDKRGSFIVFEGGEGSGKDTIIERLKLTHPQNTVFTREPGGTVIGERIRALLLGKDISDMDVRTELLLFLAARAQLIAQIITPALSEGKTVITNRFGLSTIAYQIYGRNRHDYLPFLREVSAFVTDTCTPDICILLDVTPSIGLQRVRQRHEETTRFDEETVTFHERVREGYKQHVAEFGVPHVIDADRSIEAVWNDVYAAVAPLLV